MTLENLICKGLQRATGLYDGSFVPTQAEFDQLLATTMELKAHLEAWLNKHPPEPT